ncbi:MAG: hypothetical protein OEM64_07900 [Gammaproteobacteria bacterium]|nr:hypothetical protein [Gammaproteobacteria bacterium]
MLNEEEQPMPVGHAWGLYIAGLLFGGTFLVAMFFSAVDSVLDGNSGFFGAVDSLVVGIVVFQSAWIGMTYILCRALKVHGANALWCCIPLALLAIEIYTS